LTVIAYRASVLIATLWVGSLWTIGYIVAPTLFASLPDATLAGSMAGKLFRVEAWLSVASAVTLAVLVRVDVRWNPQVRRHVFWLVGGMLGCTLFGYFGIQPFMSALRETAGSAGVMESAARTRFGVLHGVASAFYLVQSILGAVLILKLSASRDN
jgi:hypothetical protein